MNNIFFNNAGRVRSGWRSLVFLVSFLLLSTLLIILSLAVIKQLPAGAATARFMPLTLPFAISAVVAITFGAVYGKLFEQLPFRSLGISFRGSWLQHFLLGAVLGSVALCSGMLSAVAVGGLSLSINRQSSLQSISATLITTLVIFLVGALSEETLFRGYLLQTLTRANSVVVGIVLTSLLFAFAHNNNPGANPLSIINTLLAGIWFAIAYLKTYDLWFPLGIHFMWNWLQGPVFGINVSGVAELSSDPILRTADLGPAWLTGGGYGLEGGVACTFAIIVSIGLIYYLPLPRADQEMLELNA
ncbi:MAG: lysostaphin resistance A-like protein [Pyrinomonadaceae bacterium]